MSEIKCSVQHVKRVKIFLPKNNSISKFKIIILCIVYYYCKIGKLFTEETVVERLLTREQ